jgi:hypothetical protein
MTALLCAVLLCQDGLEELVKLLESADPQVRQMARDRLVEAGARAVPALEARLRQKGAYAAHELLNELNRPGWIADGVVAAAAAPDGSYPRARLQAAHVQFKEGRYRDAIRIADALLVLEPEGDLARDLGVLKQACEQRLLQAEFLQLLPASELARAVVGTKVRLDFTVVNVSHGPLVIDFGAGRGALVVDLRVRMVEPMGGERIASRALTAELDRQISLGAGERKTFSVTLDTGEDLPEADVLRLYEAYAWFQPQFVSAGSMSTSARVIFAPVTVRVVPTADAGFLEDPLFSFRRAVDQGSTHDVFICAMLLDGPARGEAAGILVDLLAKMDADGRTVTCHMLGLITGEKFGSDLEGWKKWRASKR